MLTVHRIINDPVPSNCFVVFDKAIGNECLIIDPGSKNDDYLFSFLIDNELTPRYIILTHEHFDHCWGVNELVNRYGIPIVCSALCAEFIRLEKRNCSVFYNYDDRFIITSDTISVESLGGFLLFAGRELKFFIYPGHSDASICFIIQDCLFTGDTLIKDLRTVTKLPTGSIVKLKESLKALSELKGKGYTVYPGHGDVFGFDDYELEKAL